MTPPLPRRRFLTAGVVAAWPGRPRARGEDLAERVTVSLASGETATGRRLSVQEEEIRLDGRGWRWDAVADVTVAGPVEADGGRGWVELTGGDRLFGDATAFDGDAVTLARPGPGADDPLRLPADRVRGVRFGGGGPLTKFHRLAVLRDRGADDLILRRDGGRLGGELLAFDAAAVRLRAAAVEAAVPRGQVHALALSPELQSPAPPPARFLSVLLADGSHLTAAALSYGADGGELLTPGGVAVPLAADALRGLTAFTPALRDAGEPTVTHAGGPFGRATPRRDRTVVGRRVVAAGRPRPVGWGVSAGTTLTFAVPAGAAAFLTAFAVDAAAGELADCDVAVSLDGASVWDRTGVRAGGWEPARLRLDSAAAVTLTVAPGALGGMRDEAFWAAPRFVTDAPT